MEKRKNEKANRKEEARNANGEVKSASRKSTLSSLEDHTLPPDMVMVVTHLYNEGYFKDSNFFPRKKSDTTCFENSYALDFVKYEAWQFGRDHHNIINIKFTKCQLL
ncbi:hypothetical protein KY289_005049 [Solanum tuberosum]|nr:hypothetical protein KY289_005049 [Solanum tuberosum]